MTSEDLQLEAAKRPNLFREVNEHIGELSLASDVLGEALCECKRKDCVETIPLSREEYEAVRQVPTRFLVLPGHEEPEVERTVSTNERFFVVEKFGAAGAAAETNDPRRRRGEGRRAAEA